LRIRSGGGLWPLACLAVAALAWVGAAWAEPPRTAAPAAREPLLPAGEVWAEQNGMLEQLRWWVRPDASARLRALGTPNPARAEATRFTLTWQTPAERDAGLSDEERAEIGAAKAEQVAKAFAPPAAATAATLRLDATVREVWRPNAVLNVLIVALPGPGAPFVTQGGAAVEMALRDASSGDTLAALTCRQYAGVGAFAYAFGRTGHPRIALQACADKFAALLQRGTLAPAVDAPADAQAPVGG
jgi:hypothetical protein